MKWTDYDYKDAVERDSRPQKKVIAQQVETVFPQAISTTTGVVPDIFQSATVKDGWVTLVTDLKAGERVRLIGENDKEESGEEVLEIRDGAFRTAFAPATEKVFGFGREVDDFHTVDYEAIAMLNVSATQELHRQLQSAQAELAAKTTEISALEARDNARDAKLARLERLLLAESEVAPVSLVR